MKEYKPLLLFLVKALSLYLFWIFLHAYVLGKNGKVDRVLRNSEAFCTSQTLQGLGYKSGYREDKQQTVSKILLEDKTIVRIADVCNGLVLFVIFAGFVMCYPGKIKQKLWFIPLGIFIIYFINIIRIISLTLIQIHAPTYLEFNHHYVFTILVYSTIFILWLWYINKLNKRESEEK